MARYHNETERCRKDIERAARMYSGNREAARALGIHHGKFRELCREYGVETPYERERRRKLGEAYRKADRDQKEMEKMFKRNQAIRKHPWVGRSVGSQSAASE